MFVINKSEINKAGKTYVNQLSTSHAKADALEIINSWRSAHRKPLNVFQTRLRKLSKEVCSDSIFAQRTKRLASIVRKLTKEEKPFELFDIQDIGGCRIIVNTVQEVDQLVTKLAARKKNIDHKVRKPSDYIAKPAMSGYRSYHMKFTYHSAKSNRFNGCKIEVQIRTKLQHLWATAVETASLIMDEGFKASQGDQEWLKMFSLVASVMALIEEKPTVENTDSDYESLRSNINDIIREKNIILKTMEQFTNSIEALKNKNVHEKLSEFVSNSSYIVLWFDKNQKTSDYKEFSRKKYDRALNLYKEKEAQSDNLDVVLISIDKLSSLERAYPNYFGDTKNFVNLLKLLHEAGSLEQLVERLRMQNVI